MDFFYKDKILLDWVGENFSIILENYDDEDMYKLNSLINHDLAIRTNYPFFEFNENDEDYIEIYESEINLITDNNREVSKSSWEFQEATHTAKQKYFDIKNNNFNKNFIFKSEIINNAGKPKYYIPVSCYIWRKLEESPYGEEWERSTSNTCFSSDFENYYDVDFKCDLIHLVFSNTEINSNFITNENIEEFNNYIDEISNVDEVINEYAQDNNLNEFHVKKLFYNYSSVLELFIPKFDDINIDEYKKNSELYSLKTSLDLDKPNIGEQQKTSRKCIFEGCNIYLNQLNTGFLCKKHIDMNTDKHNEYSNPNKASPIFKQYLDIHFNVLEKIKIKHPGVWLSLRAAIMNTLFLERAGVGNLLEYKLHRFYNDISPYIRWYLREEMENEYNISHLSSELKVSTIRIEGVLSNLHIDIWEDGNKIKNNCVVPNQIEDALIVKNKPCKSQKKKDKYLYRDVETASLFLREDQEIYQCPKSIGFHIKSIY